MPVSGTHGPGAPLPDTPWPAPTPPVGQATQIMDAQPGAGSESAPQTVAPLRPGSFGPAAPMVPAQRSWDSASTTEIVSAKPDANSGPATQIISPLVAAIPPRPALPHPSASPAGMTVPWMPAAGVHRPALQRRVLNRPGYAKNLAPWVGLSVVVVVIVAAITAWAVSLQNPPTSVSGPSLASDPNDTTTPASPPTEQSTSADAAKTTKPVAAPITPPAATTEPPQEETDPAPPEDETDPDPTTDDSTPGDGGDTTPTTEDTAASTAPQASGN
jgi:hypothetical protein